MNQHEKDRAAFEEEWDQDGLAAHVDAFALITTERCKEIAFDMFQAALKYALEEEKAMRDELGNALRKLDRAYVRLLEMARDAERLNWLEQAGSINIGLITDAPHDGDYQIVGDLLCVHGKSIREALDAALAKEAK